MTASRLIVLADGVTGAQIANGLARIELALVSEAGARPQATALLCVPVSQLKAVAGAITQVVQRYEEQRHRSREAASAPDEAFRFER